MNTGVIESSQISTLGLRRVVIACPAVATGGPEALHQLDHALRRQGVEASIWYFGPPDAGVEADFARRYGSSRARSEVDSEAVLVLPEVENPAEWRARGWSRIVIWWLAAARLHPLVNYDGCFHIFQSCFAREMLGREGFTGQLVSDYLRAEFFAEGASGSKPASGRRRLILCNHRSAGWLAGARLEERDFEVEVLAGVAAEVIPTKMRAARYFLDMGWHPGRDRMLREAARCGCRVLAGSLGAAAFAGDVPLPECARIADADNASLGRRLAACEAEPVPLDEAMAGYRDWIGGQEAEFHREVAAWLKAPDGPWGAGQGVRVGSLGRDLVPGLQRELATARALQTVAGVRFLRMRNSRRPSGWCYRFELGVRKWLRILMKRFPIAKTT